MVEKYYENYNQMCIVDGKPSNQIKRGSVDAHYIEEMGNCICSEYNYNSVY